MRDETGLWLQQAEADLETAKVTLAAGRFYAVAQFSEQAVEKALKALYIQQAAELAPKSHDLKWLGEAVGAPTEMLPELRAMTKEYLVARYPDASPGTIPAMAIDGEKAQQHLDLAQRILNWVREQLSAQS